MKLISWNVNGLRACLGKGFMDYFTAESADFFCLQETKMQPGQAQVPAEGYHEFFNSAEKKGYSGTAIFAKQEPLSVSYGMGSELHDHEGRLITLEYDRFYLVTVYTPNSQRELTRLMYRLCWEEDFRLYLKRLDEKKPVIVCGDMNVAHKEIDLKNPKTNTGNAGFTPQEREAMTRLLDSGFVDTFRLLHPDATGAYSWWSYMFNARANNAGWRIDYFLVSERIRNRVREARIDAHVMGSDHCPVVLDIDL
ncbi:MAG: exodeoxyribonuclease III [Clostridiales bacterium]|nr:exodeoxyribonuclease III [Clostridiales bacterium]